MNGSNSQRARARVKERRNSPRLRVDPLVYLKIVPENGGFLFDLGEGGIGIRVANPLVMATQIRFSFLLQERQLVQGIGKICWLADTGRSAGVRFLRLSDEAQDYIRQWMRAERSGSQEGQSPLAPMEVIPGAAASQAAEATLEPERQVAQARSSEAETGRVPTQTNDIPQGEVQKAPSASAFSLFSAPPARPDAMGAEPPAANQPSPEKGWHPAMPPSTLLFLPNKSDQEIGSDSFRSAETPRYVYRAGEQTLSDSVETAALQSAVFLGSALEENENRNKPRSGKIWLAAALCAALAALAVLAVMSRSYPGALAKVHGFVSAMQSQYAPQLSAKAPPSPRLEGRVRRGRELARQGRRSQPSRLGDVLQSPSAGESPSAMGITGLSAQVLPGTLSGQSLALGQPSGLTVSVTSSAPHLQFGGLMPDLRNDGALVEEGVPISAPLELGNQASVPKSIVLEAVIGKDGGVKNVRLIRAPDSKLAQAVVSAVKQWRYRPLYENGTPVEFTTRITFSFSMPHRNP